MTRSWFGEDDWRSFGQSAAWSEAACVHTQLACVQIEYFLKFQGGFPVDFFAFHSIFPSCRLECIPAEEFQVSGMMTCSERLLFSFIVGSRMKNSKRLLWRILLRTWPKLLSFSRKLPCWRTRWPCIRCSFRSTLTVRCSWSSNKPTPRAKSCWRSY